MLVNNREYQVVARTVNIGTEKRPVVIYENTAVEVSRRADGTVYQLGVRGADGVMSLDCNCNAKMFERLLPKLAPTRETDEHCEAVLRAEVQRLFYVGAMEAKVFAIILRQRATELFGTASCASGMCRHVQYAADDGEEESWTRRLAALCSQPVADWHAAEETRERTRNNTMVLGGELYCSAHKVPLVEGRCLACDEVKP